MKKLTEAEEMARLLWKVVDREVMLESLELAQTSLTCNTNARGELASRNVQAWHDIAALRDALESKIDNHGDNGVREDLEAALDR